MVILSVVTGFGRAPPQRILEDRGLFQMPTRIRNPFAVLGITPQIVSRLDDETLYKMIRVCYRVLQLAAHPDQHKKTETAQRKSTERATEINLAYERLNLTKDPDSFQEYKERYLKSSGRGDKKTSKIQHALQLVVDRNREMAESLWGCLTHSKDKSAPGSKRPLSCLDSMESISFSLIDVAIKDNMRSEPWASGVGYKEIKFDGSGKMHYRFPNRKGFSEINFIRLIGTIPKGKIDISSFLEKQPLKSALCIPCQSPITGPRRKYLETKNTIPVAEFKWYCLPYLRPDLVEGSYLFSIHKNTTDKVHLEGIVLRITTNGLT